MSLGCSRFASENQVQFCSKVIQKINRSKLLSNTYEDKKKLYANSAIHMQN